MSYPTSDQRIEEELSSCNELPGFSTGQTKRAWVDSRLGDKVKQRKLNDVRAFVRAGPKPIKKGLAPSQVLTHKCRRQDLNLHSLVGNQALNASQAFFLAGYVRLVRVATSELQRFFADVALYAHVKCTGTFGDDSPPKNRLPGTRMGDWFAVCGIRWRTHCQIVANFSR
jgi:hypothetical protein